VIVVQAHKYTTTCHTNYICLTAVFRTARISRHQKGKAFWILTKQEMMGGSGISWRICKSFAPCTRQKNMPVPHHSVFLQARCFSCCLTNSVKALKAMNGLHTTLIYQ